MSPEKLKPVKCSKLSIGEKQGKNMSIYIWIYKNMNIIFFLNTVVSLVHSSNVADQSFFALKKSFRLGQIATCADQGVCGGVHGRASMKSP